MPLDPVSITVAGPVIEKVAELLGEKVVGKWSDYRSRRFVSQFVDAVSSGLPSASPAETERRLSELLEDDKKSAALYDAFRHVVFSASRDIGPRVLALHMAEVLGGLVDDAEVSDAVMSSASTLLDFEFEEFLSYASANGIDEESFADSVHSVAVVKFDTQDFDSNWRSGRQPTGPLPLRLAAGSWAKKLEATGLVVQDISEEVIEYREDSERHIDDDGYIRRVHRNIELREGVGHLIRLTRLAIRARDSS
jgi:hypothetical protein